MKQLAPLKISDHFWQKIQQEKKRTGQTTAAVIRALIEKGLSNVESK